MIIKYMYRAYECLRIGNKALRIDVQIEVQIEQKLFGWIYQSFTRKITSHKIQITRIFGSRTIFVRKSSDIKHILT